MGTRRAKGRRRDEKDSIWAWDSDRQRSRAKGAAVLTIILRKWRPPFCHQRPRGLRELGAFRYPSTTRTMGNANQFSRLPRNPADPSRSPSALRAAAAFSARGTVQCPGAARRMDTAMVASVW